MGSRRRLGHVGHLTARSITAQTEDIALLKAAAADERLDYVELFDGHRLRRHLGQVKLEILGNRSVDWFPGGPP